LSVVDELGGLSFESNAASPCVGCYDERGSLPIIDRLRRGGMRGDVRRSGHGDRRSQPRVERRKIASEKNGGLA
jgi:hypothetical protein